MLTGSLYIFIEIYINEQQKKEMNKSDDKAASFCYTMYLSNTYQICVHTQIQYLFEK